MIWYSQCVRSNEVWSSRVEYYYTISYLYESTRTDYFNIRLSIVLSTGERQIGQKTQPVFRTIGNHTLQYCSQSSPYPHREDICETCHPALRLVANRRPNYPSGCMQWPCWRGPICARVIACWQNNWISLSTYLCCTTDKGPKNLPIRPNK